MQVKTVPALELKQKCLPLRHPAIYAEACKFTFQWHEIILHVITSRGMINPDHSKHVRTPSQWFLHFLTNWQSGLGFTEINQEHMTFN